MLAVLIDADNVPAQHAEVILAEINKLGEPSLRRIYGDWSAGPLKSWSDKSRLLGFVEQQAAANTHFKNATDIAMTIDAMDILHRGGFDGFVLVSSDSDFTALANRIRESGKIVYGVGERKAPPSLRNVCNRFIYIENLVKKPDDDKAKPSAPTEKIPNLTKLILRAIERIEQDDDWYTLSQIGSRIRADNPDFDPRSYGKTKLSELVKQNNKFKMRQTNTIWYLNYAGTNP